ncbi:hypothetical protein KAR91_47440 [Candidatus Pacearchaeota archaeon]|nr:hypothetical protein [Candidatus Pacearchaeota archaeon]
MKLDKLFELARHMGGAESSLLPFNFTDKIILENHSEQSKVFTKGIQAFIHGAGKEENKKVIQAFTGSADLPVLTKDVFNVTNQVNNYDLLWQESFKGITLNQGQLSWEIATITSGSEFRLIPEGGKVEFESYEGTKITVDIQKYGMGIGITWETIEGRKLYRFIDQMEQVRSKLYGLWADVHYGLLATAGATNQIAWQGVATQSTVDRDIQTINKGYEDLGEDVKDSGYGDTANARMLIYASPKLKARIEQALRSTDRGAGAKSSGIAATAGDSGQVVQYNVDSRYSWNSAIPANKALLVLPGNKIQNSVYLSSKELSKEEMESLNQLRSYWTAFGAAIGDNDQVYELAFV